MNAKKAKKIRKKIYGDMSLHTRCYISDEKGTVYNHPTSLRASYQRAKRRNHENSNTSKKVRSGV